jgi:hypothetical protein
MCSPPRLSIAECSILGFHAVDQPALSPCPLPRPRQPCWERSPAFAATKACGEASFRGVHCRRGGRHMRQGARGLPRITIGSAAMTARPMATVASAGPPRPNSIMSESTPSGALAITRTRQLADLPVSSTDFIWPRPLSMSSPTIFLPFITRQKAFSMKL